MATNIIKCSNVVDCVEKDGKEKKENSYKDFNEFEIIYRNVLFLCVLTRDSQSV